MNRYCAASIALTLSVCGLSDQASASDTKEIAKLIPTATAMRRADFQKMAQTAATPRASDFADKSLTLMLMALPIDQERSDKQKQEFEYLGEKVPRPTDLVAEVDRALGQGILSLRFGPVTMIHANRIRDLTCSVKGTTAHGVVAFEAPKLYRGRVKYVAVKKNGKWRITEFEMPANKIHITRGDQGSWSLPER